MSNETEISAEQEPVSTHMVRLTGSELSQGVNLASYRDGRVSQAMDLAAWIALTASLAKAGGHEDNLLGIVLRELSDGGGDVSRQLLAALDGYALDCELPWLAEAAALEAGTRMPRAAA